MFNLGMPKSVSGRASRDVSASIERVFDFVAENFFENYPRWCPQIVEVVPLDSGVVQVGSKGRQTTTENGAQTTSLFEISRFDRPNLFELVGTSDHFRSTYKFIRQDPSHTQISFILELTEIDNEMRPFRKLIERALMEGAHATVENIAALLERGEAGTKENRASLA